jgi:hypothetical protein
MAAPGAKPNYNAPAGEMSPFERDVDFDLGQQR